MLTAADPEPAPGTVVRDDCGVEWRRDLDGGAVCWSRADGGGDPESWGKIAGNYGPVTVLDVEQARGRRAGFRQSAWDLARACRQAVDGEVYGGVAPSDSNALSEVRPTRLGAAFSGEADGGRFVVVVLPADDPVARELAWPDW